MRDTWLPIQRYETPSGEVLYPLFDPWHEALPTATADAVILTLEPGWTAGPFYARGLAFGRAESLTHYLERVRSEEVR